MFHNFGKRNQHVQKGGDLLDFVLVLPSYKAFATDTASIFRLHAEPFSPHGRVLSICKSASFSKLRILKYMPLKKC